MWKHTITAGRPSYTVSEKKEGTIVVPTPEVPAPPVEPSPYFQDFLKQELHCTYKDYQALCASLLVSNSVITPFQADAYAKARRDSYSQIDVYSAVICYCHGISDIIACVNFARTHNVKIAPRAGGHCTAGYSVLTNGMVLDISNMSGLVVDTVNKVGFIEAGCTWQKIDSTVQVFNLHVTSGGCPPVGVAGYSMGGGYGFTARAFGMSCDNILEATIVTAAGEVLVCNATLNPDIYFAICGGMGGNYGILVSIKMQLYPVNQVYGVQIVVPVEQAASTLELYQAHYTKGQNDKYAGSQASLCHVEITHPMFKNTDTSTLTKVNAPNPLNLSLPAGLTSSAPDIILTPVLIFNGMHVVLGNPSAEQVKQSGQRAFEKIIQYTSKFALAKNEFVDKFSNVNDDLLNMVEGIIPAATVREFKMSAMGHKLLKASEFQYLIDKWMQSPGKYNIANFESYGGAINAPTRENAWVHRDQYFDFFFDTFFFKAEDADEAAKWCSEFIEDVRAKGMLGPESYQNYPNAAYVNWKEAYFGKDNGVWEKLRAVKTKVDPTWLFYNPAQGVPPAGFDNLKVLPATPQPAPTTTADVVAATARKQEAQQTQQAQQQAKKKGGAQDGNAHS